MFNYKYETRYGDYKDFDTIKPGSVLDIIQDISTKCSEESGYGMLKLRDMKKAWLLKGTKLQFTDRVKTLCPIDAYTAVKPPKGATSNRGCILMQNGTVVAKSISDWFLFDTESLRPVRIPKEMASAYAVSDFENDEFFNYKKPDIIEDAEALYEIRVANKDIDTNMHLNNQKGAEILMDALPYDYEFRTVTLFYKRAAYLGDVLDVCMERTADGYYVHLKTKENEICVVGRFQ